MNAFSRPAAPGHTRSLTPGGAGDEDFLLRPSSQQLEGEQNASAAASGSREPRKRRERSFAEGIQAALCGSVGDATVYEPLAPGEDEAMNLQETYKSDQIFDNGLHKDSFSACIFQNMNEPMKEKCDDLFESHAVVDADEPFGKLEASVDIKGTWKDEASQTTFEIRDYEGLLFFHDRSDGKAGKMERDLYPENGRTTYTIQLPRFRSQKTIKLWWRSGELWMRSKVNDEPWKPEEPAVCKRLWEKAEAVKPVIRKISAQPGGVAVLYDRPLVDVVRAGKHQLQSGTRSELPNEKVPLWPPLTHALMWRPKADKDQGEVLLLGQSKMDYKFTKANTKGMTPEQNGKQVSRLAGNACAWLDMEMTGGGIYEWTFLSVADETNNEGLYFGMTATPVDGIPNYKSEGWICISAKSGRLFVNGEQTDIAPMASGQVGLGYPIGQGSTISFKLDLNQGVLQACINKDEGAKNPNWIDLLKEKRTLFSSTKSGKWYPAVFVNGTKGTVRFTEGKATKSDTSFPIWLYQQENQVNKCMDQFIVPLNCYLKCKPGDIRETYLHYDDPQVIGIAESGCLRTSWRKCLKSDESDYGSDRVFQATKDEIGTITIDMDYQRYKLKRHSEWKYTATMYTGGQATFDFDADPLGHCTLTESSQGTTKVTKFVRSDLKYWIHEDYLQDEEKFKSALNEEISKFSTECSDIKDKLKLREDLAIKKWQNDRDGQTGMIDASSSRDYSDKGSCIWYLFRLDHLNVVWLPESVLQIVGSLWFEQALAKDKDDALICVSESTSFKRSSKKAESLTIGKRIIEICEVDKNTGRIKEGVKKDSNALFNMLKKPSNFRLTLASPLENLVENTLRPDQAVGESLFDKGDSFTLEVQGEQECIFVGLAIQGKMHETTTRIRVSSSADNYETKPLAINMQKLESGDDNAAQVFLLTFVHNRDPFEGNKLHISFETGSIEISVLTVFGVLVSYDKEGKRTVVTDEMKQLFSEKEGADGSDGFDEKEARVLELMHMTTSPRKVISKEQTCRCMCVFNCSSQQPRIFHFHSRYWLGATQGYFNPNGPAGGTYDASSGEEPWEQVFQFQLRDVAVSPDGKYVAAVTHQKFVVWRTRDGKREDFQSLRTLSTEFRKKYSRSSAALQKLKSVSWRQIAGQDNSQLLLGCSDGDIMIYEQIVTKGYKFTLTKRGTHEVRSRFELCCIVASLHHDPVTAMTLTTDNDTVISCTHRECVMWSFHEVERRFGQTGEGLREYTSTEKLLEACKTLEEHENQKVVERLASGTNQSHEATYSLSMFGTRSAKVEQARKIVQDNLPEKIEADRYFTERMEIPVPSEQGFLRLIKVLVLNHHQLATLSLFADQKGNSSTFSKDTYMLKLQVWSLNLDREHTIPELARSIPMRTVPLLSYKIKLSDEGDWMSASVCITTQVPGIAVCIPGAIAFCELLQDVAIMPQKRVEYDALMVDFATWMPRASKNMDMVLLASGTFSSSFPMYPNDSKSPIKVHTRRKFREAHLDITAGISGEMLFARIPRMRFSTEAVDLNGSWNKATIKGNILIWHKDGLTDDLIDVTNTSCKMRDFTANLHQDGTLHWSNGSIWVRTEDEDEDPNMKEKAWWDAKTLNRQVGLYRTHAFLGYVKLIKERGSLGVDLMEQQNSSSKRVKQGLAASLKLDVSKFVEQYETDIKASASLFPSFKGSKAFELNVFESVTKSVKATPTFLVLSAKYGGVQPVPPAEFAKISEPDPDEWKTMMHHYKIWAETLPTSTPGGHYRKLVVPQSIAPSEFVKGGRSERRRFKEHFISRSAGKTKLRSHVERMELYKGIHPAIQPPLQDLQLSTQSVSTSLDGDNRFIIAVKPALKVEESYAPWGSFLPAGTLDGGKWFKFQRGGEILFVPAILRDTEVIIPPSKAEQESRYDGIAGPYTYEEFEAHYGKENANGAWKRAEGCAAWRVASGAEVAHLQRDHPDGLEICHSKNQADRKEDRYGFVFKARKHGEMCIDCKIFIADDTKETRSGRASDGRKSKRVKKEYSEIDIEVVFGGESGGLNPRWFHDWVLRDVVACPLKDFQGQDSPFDYPCYKTNAITRIRERPIAVDSDDEVVESTETSQLRPSRQRVVAMLTFDAPRKLGRVEWNKEHTGLWASLEEEDQGDETVKIVHRWEGPQIEKVTIDPPSDAISKQNYQQVLAYANAVVARPSEYVAWHTTDGKVWLAERKEEVKSIWLNDYGRLVWTSTTSTEERDFGIEAFSKQVLSEVSSLLGTEKFHNVDTARKYEDFEFKSSLVFGGTFVVTKTGEWQDSIVQLKDESGTTLEPPNFEDHKATWSLGTQPSSYTLEILDSNKELKRQFKIHATGNFFARPGSPTPSTIAVMLEIVSGWKTESGKRVRLLQGVAHAAELPEELRIAKTYVCQKTDTLLLLGEWKKCKKTGKETDSTDSGFGIMSFQNFNTGIQLSRQLQCMLYTESGSFKFPSFSASSEKTENSAKLEENGCDIEKVEISHLPTTSSRNSIGQKFRMSYFWEEAGKKQRYVAIYKNSSRMVYVAEIRSDNQKPAVFKFETRNRVYAVQGTRHGVILAYNWNVTFLHWARMAEFIEKGKKNADMLEPGKSSIDYVQCHETDYLFQHVYGEQNIERFGESGVYEPVFKSYKVFGEGEKKEENLNLPKPTDYFTSFVELSKDLIAGASERGYAIQFFQFNPLSQTYTALGEGDYRDKLERIQMGDLTRAFIWQPDRVADQSNPEKLQQFYKRPSQQIVFRLKLENIVPFICKFSPTWMCVMTKVSIFFVQRPEVNELFDLNRGREQGRAATIWGRSLPMFVRDAGDNKIEWLYGNRLGDAVLDATGAKGIGFKGGEDDEKQNKTGENNPTTQAHSGSNKQQVIEIKALALLEQPKHIAIYALVGCSILKSELDEEKNTLERKELKAIAEWPNKESENTKAWDSMLVCPNGKYLTTYSQDKPASIKIWDAWRPHENKSEWDESYHTASSASFKAVYACFTHCSTNLVFLTAPSKDSDNSNMLTKTTHGSTLRDSGAGSRVIIMSTVRSEVLMEIGVDMLSLAPEEYLKYCQAGISDSEKEISDHIIIQTSAQRLIYQSLKSPLNFVLTPKWLRDETKPREAEGVLVPLRSQNLEKVDINQERLSVKTTERKSDGNTIQSNDQEVIIGCPALTKRKGGIVGDKWYFELTLTDDLGKKATLTIGWTTFFEKRDGKDDQEYAIGKDDRSWGYKISNKEEPKIIFNGKEYPTKEKEKEKTKGTKSFTSGARIGTSINFADGEIKFYVDGVEQDAGQRFNFLGSQGDGLMPVFSGNPFKGVEFCPSREGQVGEVKYLPEVKDGEAGFQPLQQGMFVKSVPESEFLGYNLQSCQLSSCLEVPGNAFTASPSEVEFPPSCARISGEIDHGQWWRPKLDQLLPTDRQVQGKYIEVNLGGEFWVQGIQLQGLAAEHVTSVVLELKSSLAPDKPVKYELREDEKDETADGQAIDYLKSAALGKKLHNSYYVFTPVLSQAVRVQIHTCKMTDPRSSLGLRLEVYYSPPKLMAFHAADKSGQWYDVYYRRLGGKQDPNEIALDKLRLGIANKMTLHDLKRAFKYKTKDQVKLMQDMRYEFDKFQLAYCALYMSDQQQHLQQVQWMDVEQLEGMEEFVEDESVREQRLLSERIASPPKAMRNINPDSMILGLGFGNSYRSLLHQVCSDPKGKADSLVSCMLGESGLVAFSQDMNLLIRAICPAFLFTKCAAERLDFDVADEDTDTVLYRAFRPMDAVCHGFDEKGEAKNLSFSSGVLETMAQSLLKYALDHYTLVGEEGWWHIRRVLEQLPIQTLTSINLDKVVLMFGYVTEDSGNHETRVRDSLTELATVPLQPSEDIRGQLRYLIALPSILGIPGYPKTSLLHRGCDNPDFCKTKLVQAIIKYKWSQYAKLFFTVELLGYLIYLSLFSAFSLQIAWHPEADDPVSSWVLRGLILCVIFSALNDVGSLFIEGLWEYWVGNLWFLHVCDWSVNASLVIVTLGFHFRIFLNEIFVDNEARHNTMLIFCSVAAVVMWIRILVYFALGFQRTSEFVRIVMLVLTDCLPLGIMSCTILSGCSHALFLMSHAKETTAEAEAGPFATFLKTMMTSYEFLLGKYPFGALEDSGIWSRVLLYVLAGLVSIILLNVLIAKMNDTYAHVKIRATEQHVVAQATRISNLEMKYNLVIWMCFANCFKTWITTESNLLGQIEEDKQQELREIQKMVDENSFAADLLGAALNELNEELKTSTQGLGEGLQRIGVDIQTQKRAEEPTPIKIRGGEEHYSSLTLAQVEKAVKGHNKVKEHKREMAKIDLELDSMQERIEGQNTELDVLLKNLCLEI